MNAVNPSVRDLSEDRSDTTDSGTRPPEVAVINAVQATIGAKPAVVSAARGMSHFGEHALGWVGIAAAGWLVDKPRRRQWAGVAVGAVGAHAASIVIKRIVRRPRPNDPSVQVNVSTPSKLSFPSSHATSTTAAAVLLGRLTGLPLPAVLVPPMLLSRVVLGVHYPSDVLAGSALGAASAAVVLAAEKRFDSDRTGKSRG
ncbi:phosphatase PAP2 family protein [Nocardia arthritidis]|uniref:Phosphatase PAP2 family protein n=1 Tax=Nocardia arthritidis TaxID=228602 RepID=A0A6G9Y4H8_9NOCA|nr:phosphatase PAP2 family protein [Nocardia arthritidis]